MSNYLELARVQYTRTNSCAQVRFDIFQIKNTSGTEVSLLDTFTATKTVCIAGHAGVGKSYLARKFFSRWLETNKPKQVMLYVDLCLYQTHDDFQNLLERSVPTLSKNVVEDIANALVSSEGDNFIIILDNITKEMLEVKTSIIHKLLCHKLYPKASFMITTRFTAVNAVKKVMTLPCSYIILEGIKDGHEREILDVLCTEFKADRMMEYIRYNCLELCKIPGLITIILKAFRTKSPETFTKMVERLVIMLINNHIKEYNLSYGVIESLSNLPDEISSHFSLVCKLAYLLIENDSDSCGYMEFSKLITLNTFYPSISQENIGLGLLQLDSLDGDSYKFVHLTIQEFLATYYIAKEPLLDQVLMLNKLLLKKERTFFTDARCSRLYKFYFGMVHLLEYKDSSNAVKSKFETVCAMRGLLEAIGSKLCIDDEQDIQTIKLTFLYQLLHECQDANMVRKFMSKRERYLKLSLDPTKLPEPLINIITFIILHSGISKWQIDTPERMFHSVQYISMSIETEKPQIELRTNVTDKNLFVLQPLVKATGKLKPYAPLSIYVRCMREILHRILQLYSPIKLKSDSSEPSYISFLGCECLKEKLEKEQMLAIEPIHAIHWLTSPMKEDEIKSLTLKRTKENTEYHSHMTMHNMQQVEMILMVSPMPNRIHYVDPSTKDKIPIQLCRNPLPYDREGQIVTSLKHRLTTDIKQSTIVTLSELSSNLASCMVALPLPIPKSDNDLFSRVITSVDNLWSSQNQIEARGENTEAVEEPDPDNEDAGNEGDYVVADSPYISSYANFNNQFSSVQQSVQQQTQSQQRPIASHPGTVVYSTIPTIFPMDQILQTPDEAHLIKRGGNGSIYAVSYGGFDFAVKKTAYRNREIQIHKKLKNPNIVELSCLMFGHQQPQYKRRYFCYHFMPRATGDLARMVTDKVDLTMVNLSKRYRDNPLTLGSMQGNWKYILKELLKGLKYMHSMNIIHRDMKASNVLIKMACSCDNPLICTCHTKCSVQIADFDAALQLDMSNNLQSSPYTTRQPLQHEYNNVYQVVPVGTDGYRAPESAQQVISSHLETIQPPLTVKADIWAVGLIVMRMLNGYNGPIKQRQVSTCR